MEIIAYDKAKLNNTAVALGKFEGIHKGHMLLINKITNLSYKSVVFTINMPDEKVINLDDERYDIFDKFDYVALGHLHGPQQINEHIRYSGSPMAYSFGKEEKQEKSVDSLLDFFEGRDS